MEKTVKIYSELDMNIPQAKESVINLSTVEPLVQLKRQKKCNDNNTLPVKNMTRYFS